MSSYAAGTEVTSEKSRYEIERTLKRYGADAFGYQWEGTSATVGFRIKGRYVRMVLPLPDPSEKRFHFTEARNQRRSAKAAEDAWEQACRQRWRALALVVKAKLEAVESGISTVEREFLADIMLPNGRTVGQEIEPQITDAYLTGKTTLLLSPATP